MKTPKPIRKALKAVLAYDRKHVPICYACEQPLDERHEGTSDECDIRNSDW